MAKGNDIDLEAISMKNENVRKSELTRENKDYYGRTQMEIGNKINQLRKLSGMTQEQLAEKLNVSRQTISKWESDSTSPDLESIVKISRIFMCH